MSLELDYHSDQNFKKKYFKKPTAETDSIYLDEKELSMIHEKPFTHHRTIILNNGVKLTGDKLERAKDIFLISSFTGLRVGDAKKFYRKILHAVPKTWRISEGGEDWRASFPQSIKSSLSLIELKFLHTRLQH